MQPPIGSRPAETRRPSVTRHRGRPLADLPDAILRRHRIAAVPLQVTFGDTTDQDPESGWGAAAIVSELDRVRSQSGLFLTVDTYENLLRSGRVSPARGRNPLLARVLQLVDRALSPRPAVVRFGVAHAEAPEMAERLRNARVAACRPRDCFVAQATGVLGTHVGHGAGAVFFQGEDGTSSRPATDGRA